jgi:four helix bundle protein
VVPYERFAAWKECHALAIRIYRVTLGFPKHELYGLTSQIRRAAFSAAVNIVEGSSRRGSAEFRRFLDISLGSLSEVGYILRFARELELLNSSEWKELDDQQQRARYLTWKLYDSIARPKKSITAVDRPRPPSPA